MKFFNEEELVLPLSVPKGIRLISYDMGGSLFKLAYTESYEADKVKIKMVTFDNVDLEDAMEFMEKDIVKGSSDVTIIASGIGSRSYKDKFTKRFKANEIILTDEFISFGKGFHYMLKNLPESEYLHEYADVPVPSKAEMGMDKIKVNHVTDEEEQTMRNKTDIFPAVLCFCGSGAAFMALYEDGSADMVAGAPMAGMAFHGLGKLLTGAKSYNELMDLARKGDSTVCTTTMFDFDVQEYADMDVKKYAEHAPFTFEIFPFGNVVRKGVKNPKQEDMARSLLHLVGDNLMHTSMPIAAMQKVNKVYYAGSVFKNNDVLKTYMSRLPLVTLTVGWPLHPRFLKFEGYVGVLGAIIEKIEEINQL